MIAFRRRRPANFANFLLLLLIMNKCKTTVKENIDHELFGYEEEKATIRNLFLRVIKESECNSALLIGPNGSGKTLVRNRQCLHFSVHA